MTEKPQRFVTPYKYAQLCGVSESAIYGRIERGVITVKVETSLDGKQKRYIDTEMFPPKKMINYPIEYKKGKEKK